jgi:hypothetical protein
MAAGQEAALQAALAQLRQAQVDKVAVQQQFALIQVDTNIIPALPSTSISCIGC